MALDPTPAARREDVRETWPFLVVVSLLIAVGYFGAMRYLARIGMGEVVSPRKEQARAADKVSLPGIWINLGFSAVLVVVGAILAVVVRHARRIFNEKEKECLEKYGLSCKEAEVAGKLIHSFQNLQTQSSKGK